MIYVKICGITNLEIAKLIAEEGVNALGFVFAPSRRKIEPNLAREVIKYLPPELNKVGVFVNSSRQDILDIINYTRITTIQLHGDESPEFCLNWNVEVWKALRVKDEKSIVSLEEYQVDKFVLDAFSQHSYGGTGKTCDWNLVKKLTQTKKKIILAGGLDSENVSKAIMEVCPFGLDVSSGVEQDGIKDKNLIKSFMRKVREANDKNREILW